MGGETMRCSCRKTGLNCSTGCGKYHGIFENRSAVDISEDD